MTRAVRKTVIKLVILSGGCRGDINPTDCSLEEIAREMDTGCFLGSWDIESDEDVPADKVKEECVKLRNDGTFFDEDI